VKKHFAVTALVLLCTSFCNGQILRKVKDFAKAKAEQIAIQKANEVIDKGVNNMGKGKNKQNNASGKTNKDNPDKGKDKSGKKGNDPKKPGNNNEGLIELEPSVTTTFISGMVTFSGKSINYKDNNTVKINITGAKNYKEERTIKMLADGSYYFMWYAPAKTGKYNVTATSSDQKANTSVEIEVTDMFELDEMATENIKETEKAQKKLEESIEKVKTSITSEQAKELEAKLDIVKDKTRIAIKMFQSINAANKKIAGMVSKGKVLPRDMADNLSQLNSTLKQHTEELKNQQEFANHAPFDNTICEYLVLANEACAAFSTFSGMFAGNLIKIVKGIIIGKGPTIATDAANNAMGNAIPPGTDFIPKEGGKVFLTVADDANTLSTAIGKAGFAGDLISFMAEVLLKMYCGTYSGEMTQTFSFNFRNNNGVSFWRYNGVLKALLNLRYPKSGATGKIIKMKGSLEGNATSFGFFADPKEAVADELGNAYNSTVVLTVADLKPPTFPFAIAQADKAGFGAVARVAVTPASFYIPIDAEYNLDSKQIKLFINPAIMDFSPMIKNRKVFIVIAVLPMFRWEDFPIEKAQKLIHGALKDKNWFTVTGESSGKPSFNGTINRKANAPGVEINLSATFKAQKN
jgi:hypothetical protein